MVPYNFKLVENCEYSMMKDQMIRDRLVVGNTLSQKLQMNASLTLEKAKKEIRQREAVHELQLTLKGWSLEAVRMNLRRVNRHGQQQQLQGRQSRQRPPLTGKNSCKGGRVNRDHLLLARHAHIVEKASTQKSNALPEKLPVDGATALVTIKLYAT